MVNRIEAAVVTASDRLSLDSARYRSQAQNFIADLRGSVVTALVVYGGRESYTARRLSLRSLDQSWRSIRVMMAGMFEDLNYKHQVYLADELGKIGGIRVSVTRDKSDMSRVMMAGKTWREWVDTAFSRAERKIKRMSGHEVTPDSAAEVLDELSLTVMRTIMVYVAALDSDNKFRVISGLADSMRSKVWQ